MTYPLTPKEPPAAIGPLHRAFYTPCGVRARPRRRVPPAAYLRNRRARGCRHPRAGRFPRGTPRDGALCRRCLDPFLHRAESSTDSTHVRGDAVVRADVLALRRGLAFVRGGHTQGSSLSPGCRCVAHDWGSAHRRSASRPCPCPWDSASLAGPCSPCGRWSCTAEPTRAGAVSFLVPRI
jgi:hypothetical protein